MAIVVFDAPASARYRTDDGRIWWIWWSKWRDARYDAWRGTDGTAVARKRTRPTPFGTGRLVIMLALATHVGRIAIIVRGGATVDRRRRLSGVSRPNRGVRRRPGRTGHQLRQGERPRPWRHTE